LDGAEIDNPDGPDAMYLDEPAEELSDALVMYGVYHAKCAEARGTEEAGREAANY
jgi:hypothetical protein